MKLTIDISDELVKDIRNAVNDWYGIKLTDPQLVEILSVPRILGECISSGVDTQTRELIGQFLANKIVGRDWPLFRDGKEASKQFFAEYEKNAPLKGYVLVK